MYSRMSNSITLRHAEAQEPSHDRVLSPMNLSQNISRVMVCASARGHFSRFIALLLPISSAIFYLTFQPFLLFFGGQLRELSLGQSRRKLFLELFVALPNKGCLAIVVFEFCQKFLCDLLDKPRSYPGFNFSFDRCLVHAPCRVKVPDERNRCLAQIPGFSVSRDDLVWGCDNAARSPAVNPDAVPWLISSSTIA